MSKNKMSKNKMSYSEYFYEPRFIPPELRNIILDFLQRLFDNEIYRIYCESKKLSGLKIPPLITIDNIKQNWFIGQYTSEFYSLKYNCICSKKKIYVKSKKKHQQTLKHLTYLRNKRLYYMKNLTY